MLSALIRFITRFVSLFLRTSSGSFPKQLSASEERELFALARSGDRNARKRIIECNMRLVAHVVKKYYVGADDQEELVSVGTVGLIKAVDSFDSTKGARLATYAAKCIQNAILSQRLVLEHMEKVKLLPMKNGTYFAALGDILI